MFSSHDLFYSMQAAFLEVRERLGAPGLQDNLAKKMARIRSLRVSFFLLSTLQCALVSLKEVTGRGFDVCG